MVLGWGGMVVVMQSLLSLTDRIYGWFTWHRALPRGATLTEKMTMITAQCDVTKWNSAALEPITAKWSTRNHQVTFYRFGKRGQERAWQWIMIHDFTSICHTARVPKDSTNMGSLKEYRSISNSLYLCTVYLGYQMLQFRKGSTKKWLPQKMCVSVSVCAVLHPSHRIKIALGISVSEFSLNLVISGKSLSFVGGQFPHVQEWWHHT